MDWTLFLIFLAACGAAAATGALFKPGTWYAGLSKPDWTPPDRAFPIVWTVLYFLLAAAATRAAAEDGAEFGMAFWALQIALNTLWTPVFFGAHRMGIALVVIIALWIAAFGTLVAFWRLDLLAGLMILPYVVWISIAVALNFRILRMNPGATRFEADR